MQKTASVTINLAKNRGESIVDRIIGFALTTGRVLIIITELIALGAFLYRFTLDRTLVGLHDAITQEAAIVNLLHSNEVRYRGVQDRLTTASLLLKSPPLNQYLLDIKGFAPFDITIHSIAVAQDAIRIQASTQSVDSLTIFVDKLKQYPPIKSVSIDSVDNQTSTSVIAVSITATLKSAPGTKGIQGGNQ